MADSTTRDNGQLDRPHSVEELDMWLDKILRASGSALRNYSMQKSIEDMREALALAVDSLSLDKASDIAAGMARDDVDRLTGLVRELRAALQTIYAENGEDERIASICSPLIDRTRDV